LARGSTLQSEANGMPTSWALIGQEQVPFRMGPIKGQAAAAQRHGMRAAMSSFDSHSSAHNLQGGISASVATGKVNPQPRD
jgi:hypothetical protein